MRELEISERDISEKKTLQMGTWFLLWEGVVGLKELIFNSLLWEGVMVLKELIFKNFYFGRVWRS